MALKERFCSNLCLEHTGGEETYSVNRMSYKWPNTGKWEMTRENKEKSPYKGMN